MDSTCNVFASSLLDTVEPLGHSNTARLSLLPFCKKICLRGDAADAGFSSLVSNVTGLDLPIDANTFNADEHSSLLWLSPDEWQWRHSVEHCDEAMQSSTAELGRKFAGTHAAIVDISDYYVLICLSGAEIFTVLEKGSPLNLRKSLANKGQCAQSRFANAAVLLNRISDDVPTIHIQVRWSFAEYLWDYLCCSMQEFS